MTVGLLFVLTVGLTGYDFWVIAQGGVDASISQVLLDAARRQPLVAFLFGGLMGHLFFPQKVESGYARDRVAKALQKHVAGRYTREEILQDLDS